MIYRQKTKKPPKNSKKTSKTKTNMNDRLRGFIYFFFWFLSIISGFFILICPILPLVVISPKKYRKWSDIIYGMWEPFPVAMMEICFGVRVVLTGDKVNPFEGSLFVMNHRTRVDWNFFWMAMFHCCQPNAHNMKYILKSAIRHVPGPGWVMQACNFIFIKRNWNADKVLLDKMLDYLNESDALYQILIFPEGTDLSDDNIKKSHKYAKENNLEKYQRVLHPRTTGFAYLANKMKSGGQLKAIYDVTIAYPKTLPQNESDLIRGKFPEEVHFDVKRYSSSSIPFQENELKTWLTTIWQEKEKKLQRFYAVGSFEREENDMQKRSNQNFEKMHLGNGSVVHQIEELARKENSEVSLIPRDDSMPGVSFPRSGSTDETNHLSCDNIYRSKNFHPSHLLYVVLGFWFFLIAFLVYEVFSNCYVRIWILTYSLVFIGLSFVTNGFQQVTASSYFHRYKKKPPIVKKKE